MFTKPTRAHQTHIRAQPHVFPTRGCERGCRPSSHCARRSLPNVDMESALGVQTMNISSCRAAQSCPPRCGFSMLSATRNCARLARATSKTSWLLATRGHCFSGRVYSTTAIHLIGGRLGPPPYAHAKLVSVVRKHKGDRDNKCRFHTSRARRAIFMRRITSDDTPICFVQRTAACGVIRCHTPRNRHKDALVTIPQRIAHGASECLGLQRGFHGHIAATSTPPPPLSQCNVGGQLIPSRA